MRVQLSRYFQPDESPIKVIKDRLKRQKLQQIKRNGMRSMTSQTQVIDPFNQELLFFRQKASKSTVIPKGKAYQNLKQYISQQDRNLKSIKLKRITFKNDKKVKTQLYEPEISQSQVITPIPEVDQFFKNQARDSLLHENRQLRKQIDKRVHILQDNIKEYSPMKSQSLYVKRAVIPEQYDIDRKLLKDRERNHRLLSRWKDQKLRIRQQWISKKPDESYLDQPILSLQDFVTPNKKNRIILKDTKSVSIKLHNQTLKLSPSIALLYQLRNFSEFKKKKQYQLQSLLKNQYQNRQSIMIDKNNYYNKSISFNIMNPTVQFKMRKLMDQKLYHRLKLCKDQVNNFYQFLQDLKKTRTIICQLLKEILQKLRIILLSGKILKEKDFDDIMIKYQAEKELKTPINISILKKIRAMMI